LGVRWPARLRPRHESAWVWGTEGELATADLPALTDRIYGGKFQLWEHGSGIAGYYAFALPGKQMPCLTSPPAGHDPPIAAQPAEDRN
jgi:hypothetical protein